LSFQVVSSSVFTFRLVAHYGGTISCQDRIRTCNSTILASDASYNNGFEPYLPMPETLYHFRHLTILCDPVGNRTQNPYIKSVVLYQLSYEVILWCGVESNHRHLALQASALPTELPHLKFNFTKIQKSFDITKTFLRKIQDSNLWGCYTLRFSKPLHYHSVNLP
jgi:hypothetical protein